MSLLLLVIASACAQGLDQPQARGLFLAMDLDSESETARPKRGPYTLTLKELFYKNVLEINSCLHNDFKETQSPQFSERVLKVLQGGLVDDRDVNSSGSSAE